MMDMDEDSMAASHHYQSLELNLINAIDNNVMNRTATEQRVNGNNANDTMLPLDRFSQWVYCFCIVTFDIELGQALEQIYPKHVKLTEREKSNICYLSFPDSNSGCMGDTQFHFRTKLCPMRRKSISIYKNYNKTCLTPLQADAFNFYGYVYFRQVKDRSLRRGYFQKSLVLITRLPFIKLYHSIVSYLAPLYFESGINVLEAACNDIDSWPEPIPGQTFELGLVGVMMQCHIPHKNDKLISSPTDLPPASANPQILTSSPSSSSLNSLTTVMISSIHEKNLFKSLSPIISHIQVLWEFVLTCEPLIVVAPTPDVCSDVVQALVSIIWPLKFSADFRPFFTIHDSDFKEYTTKTQAPPPVILGVTNPFFTKTLQHWPHKIKIGDYQPISPTNCQKSKLQKSLSFKTLDCKPGVYTKYKSFLQKDRTVLKKILKGMESRRPAEVQSALVRRFFIELTQTFLIPLERYLTTLMPLQKNISAWRGIPSIHQFNQDDFLRMVAANGPELTTGIKGDWSGLYKKFFRCSNFANWYESRTKEVSDKLKTLQIEAIGEANLTEWIQAKAEVEIVDLVLTLKDKLTAVEQDNLPVSQQAVDKIETHINSIIASLPPDLQDILKK